MNAINWIERKTRWASIPWIEAKRWRLWLFIAVCALVIAWSLGAFAQGGGDGGGNDNRSWGDRATPAEKAYGRGMGIWSAVSIVAVPAWNYAKQFNAYVNQEGPLAMDRSGIQHANDGSRMLGGHVVGDDGHVVGGI